VAVAFRIEPGPRYDGPHGPVELPADAAPEASRIVGPRGEARLGWGMLSRDTAALDAGVPALAAGRALTMRREGRVLVFSEPDGTPIATARLRRGSRVALEDPGGERVAWFRWTKLAGEVEAAATPLHVELMLLLLVSGAQRHLERRAPLLPDLPFP
jgi:hypothetical protein